MSGDNEVVAIKSLGGSPSALIGPVLSVAFLISVAAVWVNDLAVSWGRPGMSRVIINSMQQIAYAVLRTHHSYSRHGYSITVKGVEGQKLILPIIRYRDPEDECRSFTVTAREARLKQSVAGASLGLVLKDAVFEGKGGVDGSFSGEIEHVISLNSEHRRESASDFPLCDLAQRRSDQAREVKHLASSLAAEGAFHLFAGEIAHLGSPSWSERVKQMDDARYHEGRLVTEPWRRWANSFSCLFFVTVGAPLAVRLRQTDLVTTFFAAFMPILIVYYPLMEYGVDRAKSGALPQYAVWIGNAACLVWGLWLMRRVYRN
jgi:lipopolysaccharide export system permease protein